MRDSANSTEEHCHIQKPCVGWAAVTGKASWISNRLKAVAFTEKRQTHDKQRDVTQEGNFPFHFYLFLPLYFIPCPPSLLQKYKMVMLQLQTMPKICLFSLSLYELVITSKLSGVMSQ